MTTAAAIPRPVPPPQPVRRDPMNRLHAAIKGNPSNRALGRLVLVHDPDVEGGVVPVSWRMASNRYKCAEHGMMRRAECVHAFSAGMLLASVMLGLDPAEPEGTTDND